jgi:hypothetical protein
MDKPKIKQDDIAGYPASTGRQIALIFGEKPSEFTSLNDCLWWKSFLGLEQGSG